MFDEFTVYLLAISNVHKKYMFKKSMFSQKNKTSDTKFVKQSHCRAQGKHSIGDNYEFTVDLLAISNVHKKYMFFTKNSMLSQKNQ